MWITLFCVYAESEFVYTSVDNFFGGYGWEKVELERLYTQQSLYQVYTKKNNKVLDNSVYSIYIVIGKEVKKMDEETKAKIEQQEGYPNLYAILRSCPVCLQEKVFVELSVREHGAWECDVCGRWFNSTKELLRVKNAMGDFARSRKLLNEIERGKGEKRNE